MLYVVPARHVLFPTRLLYSSSNKNTNIDLWLVQSCDGEAVPQMYLFIFLSSQSLPHSHLVASPVSMSEPETRSFHAPPLPDGTKREMDFLDSTFFKTPGQQLPTPAQVRALSKDVSTRAQPTPVISKNPNILVKFGPHVTVEEAQCLWMVRQTFQGAVPVPEVFGWRVDDEDYVFIYMELIEGQTLVDGWDDINSADRDVMRNQLREIIGYLRQLSPRSEKYIGTHALNYLDAKVIPVFIYH